MSLAIVYSRASVGIAAPLVTVETHLSNGLPRFSIVGLAEAAVQESKDRVRSALMNTQFEFPVRRITVNLGPADLPKEGGRYDLPIAIGILAASGQVPLQALENYEFAGELALSGALQPVQGILPFALQTQHSGRALIIPVANADEAALVSSCTVLPAANLTAVCAHLHKQQALLPHQPKEHPDNNFFLPDMRDVHGQTHARRALEIVAAGGHSLLMAGPPGTGKTMLASRLPGLLPDLTLKEALEIAAIHSISARGFQWQQWQRRSFRAPHHTASPIALVGGGRPPRPGEISLAHHGVLFLDELPEFQRHVLEALREPLESGTITISRAAHQAEFPARFQFIGAMNPCPCGYLGDTQKSCQCTPEQIQRYRQRLSGPLLDRIDMHIEVPRLPASTWTKSTTTVNEDSQTIKQRVQHTHEKQLARQQQCNALLTAQALKKHCVLDKASQEFLAETIEKLQLSARAYHRVLRVARTIADMAKSDFIEMPHLTEALSYRYPYHLSA